MIAELRGEFQVELRAAIDAHESRPGPYIRAHQVIAELRAEIEALRDEIWEIQANSHGHQPEEVARTLNARLTALESKPGIEGPQGPPGEVNIDELAKRLPPITIWLRRGDGTIRETQVPLGGEYELQPIHFRTIYMGTIDPETGKPKETIEPIPLGEGFTLQLRPRSKGAMPESDVLAPCETQETDR